jgi:hypothetical protein
MPGDAAAGRIDDHDWPDTPVSNHAFGASIRSLRYTQVSTQRLKGRRMQEPTPSISVITEGDILIVSFQQDELIDLNFLDQAHDTITRLIHDRIHPRIVLDLTSTTVALAFLPMSGPLEGHHWMEAMAWMP